MFQTALDFPCQHIDLGDPVNLISEKFHPDCRITVVCRKNLYRVTAHTECTTVKIHVISCVLDIDQCTDDLISVLLHSRTQRNHHSKVVLRAAQTIDTGNRGDHDHIFTLYECRRGRQTQFINLLINRRILGNISVRLWYISLRLIIIVIGYKVLHCILREELLELTVKLRRQCLIVRNDQSRLIQLCDDVRHREGLTGTGHTEQSLELVAFLEASYQFFDRLRLVTGGLVWGM